MKTKDAVSALGSEASLARFLGISRAAVNQYGDLLPELRARQLADDPCTGLRFDPSYYPRNDSVSHNRRRSLHKLSRVDKGARRAKPKKAARAR